MFPLVNFTKETCGLFFYHFIQSVKPKFHTLKILRSIQGFQAKIQDFNNLYTFGCYTTDKLVTFYLIILFNYYHCTIILCLCISCTIIMHMSISIIISNNNIIN